jgi:DNA-binding ferritin-like protein
MADDDDGAIPAGLKRILADTFVLRFIAEAALWRIDRASYGGLAGRLEKFVLFLDEVARDTALRMLVLGDTPPKTIDELMRLSSCQPRAGSDDLIDLAYAAMQVARDFCNMSLIARDSGDEATAHFLAGRLGQIEEAVWSIGRLSRDIHSGQFNDS